MLQKFIRRFIRPRHHWRDIGFDELSELYTSMMFRSLAMGLVGIFIPVYLYQHGSPVWEILTFYSIVFTAQLFATPLVAFIIARIGPKHTMLLSYLFQATSLAGLIDLNRGPASLPLIAILMGTSLSLFFTAFHVDFSKIKHREHGGKEVSWMYSMQKIGAVMGPILGGVVALVFGAQYIFWAALVLFCLGIVPLFLSKEPIKLKQQLDFEHITVKEVRRDLMCYSAFILENSVSVVVWPLFLGVMVFHDSPYIQIGSVASLSIVLSLVVARMIGVMIDKRQGRELLRFGALMNALLHLFRVFSNGFTSVLAVNLVNEGVTIAYTMPFTKGVYDAADDHPGYRIVYISALEMTGSFARMMFYTLASIVAYLYNDSRGLFFGLFVIGALASYTITRERFKALEP